MYVFIVTLHVVTLTQTPVKKFFVIEVRSPTRLPSFEYDCSTRCRPVPLRNRHRARHWLLSANEERDVELRFTLPKHDEDFAVSDSKRKIPSK